jgi:hypothetical protein
MEPKHTVSGIISLWPSTRSFAEDLGLKYGPDHARVMKVRQRIPRHHWQRLLSCAKERGIEISEHDLQAANTRRQSC